MNSRSDKHPRSLATRIQAAGRWIRNPYAAELANCRCWVTPDPDLVDLLSVEGSPSERLFGLTSVLRKSKRERRVASIPLTDAQFRDLRPLMDRLGADVRYNPPHPSTKLDSAHTRPRRKAS